MEEAGGEEVKERDMEETKRGEWRKVEEVTVDDGAWETKRGER